MEAQPFEVFNSSWGACKDHIRKVVDGHARDCAMLFLMEAGKVLSQHKFKSGRVVKFDFSMGSLTLKVYASEGAKEPSLYVDSAEDAWSAKNFYLGHHRDRLLVSLRSIMSEASKLYNDDDMEVLHALDDKRIPLYAADMERCEFEISQVNFRIQRI